MHSQYFPLVQEQWHAPASLVIRTHITNQRMLQMKDWMIVVCRITH